jgi:very-short-patch-repair endonuclease
MAGVLASGPGAVLAYRSAAAIWGLLDVRPAVETVRCSEGGRQRARVLLEGRVSSVPLIVRRTRNLPDRDIVQKTGIPVTSVARTLLDLSSSVAAAELKRAFLAADRLGLLDGPAIADCAGRDIRRNGVREFRRHASRRLAEVARTRSDLEALFLDLCRSFEIEAPEVNVPVCGFEVDCVWRPSRLIVELDGYRYHRGRECFERDAHRANILKSAGWDLLRFTWRMVVENPDRVAAQIRSILGPDLFSAQAVRERPK